MEHYLIHFQNAYNAEEVVPEVLPVVTRRPPEPCQMPGQRVPRALEDEDEAADDEDGPEERTRYRRPHTLPPFHISFPPDDDAFA